MTPDEIKALTQAVTEVKTTIEKGNESVTVQLADLANKQAATDVYIKEVEARVAASQRAGAGAGTGLSEVDAIKGAIPQRFRKSLDNYARMPDVSAEKAVRMCAMESWLKLSIHLCNPAFAARHAGAALDEMAKIEASFGFEPMGVQKVLGEASGAEGGYLVPIPLEAEVLRQIQDEAVMRNLCRVFPMSAPAHLFPNLATNVTVGIVPQATTVPLVSPTFGQRTLQSRVFGVRAIIDAFLISDSAVGLISVIQAIMSEKYALEEDRQILEGTGASEEFIGVASAASVNEVTNLNDGSLFTVAKALEQKWKGRKRSTRRDSVWIAAPEIVAQIEGLRWDGATANDKIGGFFYTPTQGLGSIQGTGLVPEGILHSFPIIGHDQLAVNRVVGGGSNCSNMYFGPWKSSVIIGDLLGLSFAVSEHTQWATNQLDLRMLKRTASLVSVPENLTKQTGLKIA